MSDIPLYKVPLTLRRGMQWATPCETCDKEIRMGPGSKAAMLRLIGAAGRKCDEHRRLLACQSPVTPPYVALLAVQAKQCIVTSAR